MLKGKATIELTNVKTHDKQVIEKTNMVTNAVNKFAKMSLCNGFGEKTFPIATKMLGGLMIFDAPLTESVDNIHFPSSAKLVGYAGQQTNTSFILRGSINSIESGAITNGYKNVWDFGTSQANGTINSLALTYNDNENTCRPFWGLSLASNIGCGTIRSPSGERYCRIICEKDSLMYACVVSSSNTSTEVTFVVNFYSLKYPIKSFNVTDIYKKPLSWQLVATKTITLQRSIFNYTSYSYTNITDGHDGYLYMPFVMDNSTGNGVLRYYRFKISDLSFDTDGLHEIICSECLFNNGGGTEQWGVLINRGKAFVKGYGIPNLNRSRYNYIIDLNNGNVTTVDFGENTFSEPVRFKMFDSGVWSGVITKALENDTYQYSESLIYPDGSIVKDSVYKTGNGPDYDGSRSYHSYFPESLFSKHNDYDSCYPVNNYLGTICNLASPVVKTNEQTMKITYTLTDA